MTATNHVLTGAAIVLAVKQPAFALPLAVLSHFVLDAIPHFGIHEDDAVKRNGHWLFQRVVIIDVVLVICSLILLPIVAHTYVNGWIILLGMLGGLAPDVVWIYRFAYEFRTKVALPHGRFARFHQWIQWSEKPWGIAVEIAWFIAMVTAVAVLS